MVTSQEDGENNTFQKISMKCGWGGNSMLLLSPVSINMFACLAMVEASVAFAVSISINIQFSCPLINRTMK